MVVRLKQSVQPILSIDDYKRAKEEFELNKKLKNAQVQEAMFKASPEGKASNLPATLQVNDAIQKALDAGDYNTANRIAWLQRSQAYGVDTFGPQGGSPETFKPFQPKVQPAEQMAEQPIEEFIPTGSSITGGTIAEQQARNAAIKKAAEKEAELKARAGLEPQLEADIAAAKARGTETAEEEKRNKARAKITNRLSDIAGYYQDLSNMGAAVEPEKGAMQNIKARMGASAIGQRMGEYLGTPEQEVRQKIEQMRPTLMSDIRQATEMGAKGLDSEKELEFYLQAVSDPRRSIGANMAALQVLNEAYGLGSQDIGASPEDVIKLKEEFNAAIKPKSGARKEIDAMQSKFNNKNDINQLLEMYAPK